MSQTVETQARIQSIEALVREAQKISDPAARSLCQQLVQAVMDLHEASFERMLEAIHQTGQTGQQIIDELGSDPLVGSLLLLYGLHPVDLQTRVVEGVDKARSTLGSQGTSIHLVRVNESGAVMLRLAGTFHSCVAPALRSLIEDAIYEVAPDVTSVVIEGLPQESAEIHGFVPIEALKQNGNGRSGTSAPTQGECAGSGVITVQRSAG